MNFTEQHDLQTDSWEPAAQARCADSTAAQLQTNCARCISHLKTAKEQMAIKMGMAVSTDMTTANHSNGCNRCSISTGIFS